MTGCNCDLSTLAKRTALYRVQHVSSGRFYIGISVDPVRRWKTHRKRARQ